jgi:hypothetical protein
LHLVKSFPKPQKVPPPILVNNFQVVKLQGLGGKLNHQSYLNSFLKDMHGREEKEWWSQLQSIEADKRIESKDLNVLLEEFQEVFNNQIQLPPERSKVHQIKLFPDHGTVNVRPYRYPTTKKKRLKGR